MFNNCPGCGAYRADKTVDPEGPYAVCPECGYEHPFVYLPLFVVTGAAGTGKTTLLRELLGAVDAVLLDYDVLWASPFEAAFARHEMDDLAYNDLWLRLCKNVAQSGRPVVLFGTGIGVPEDVEPCVERRYFSDVHYLALVCDTEEQRRRLADRSDDCGPEWEQEDFSEEWGHERQLEFNEWFFENADETEPPIELVDTTERSVDETAASVISWLTERGIETT